MRKLMLVLVLLLAGASSHAAATSTTSSTPSSNGSRADALHYLGQELRQFQSETWRWQRLMGVPLTETSGRVLAALSIDDAKGAVSLWRHRALVARQQAQHPPNLRAWLCIHRYEASWTDGGAPYYGGLQMDWGFMQHYGGWLLRHKGTAEHWTPIEQIWVAERARRSGRGFYPWPNTARYCGLL